MTETNQGSLYSDSTPLAMGNLYLSTSTRPARHTSKKLMRSTGESGDTPRMSTDNTIKTK